MTTILTERSEARPEDVIRRCYDTEINLTDVCKPLTLQEVHKVTKVDKCGNQMVYLQNKTSLYRIGFDDGLTRCMKGGFFGNQLWQIEKDPRDMSSNFYTIRNVSGNKVYLFLAEQNVNCDTQNKGDQQLWSFEESGIGYYKIINKVAPKRKLCCKSEAVFGVEDGDESDLLWRIVPIDYPLVTLFGMGAGKRLARNDEQICIEDGLVQGKQAWRIFPVDTVEPSEVFYIQNYETGYILTCSNNDTSDDSRQWRITQTEDGFINITNALTEGKLYTAEGEVRCEKDPPENDLRWTFTSPTMKSVCIKCKQITHASGYICVDSIKVWRIHPLPNDSYLMVEAYNGRRVTFDGKSLSLTEGPVRDNQMWSFLKENDQKRYWIENKQFTGQRMYMEDKDPGTCVKEMKSKVPKRTFILRDEIRAGMKYEQWLEAISINNQNFDEEDLPHEIDKKYCGSQGLDLSDEFSVYRVCRSDENLSESIMSKDPNSPRRVAQHVASGSKYSSRFISTTSSLEVANIHAYFEKLPKKNYKRKEKPLSIIKINLRLLKGTNLEASVINLNVAAVREHFVKSSTHRNYAKAAREVLFQDYIPTYSYVDLTDQLEKQFGAMNIQDATP